MNQLNHCDQNSQTRKMGSIGERASMRAVPPAEPASARRRAILRAATLLFSRYGFR
jgi:AcrR family transcriptional regulator